MTIPKLNEATIRTYANGKSRQRGEEYYRQGYVNSLTQRGNTLYAEVEGSDIQSYRVSLNFSDRDFTSATCTCPYNFDGYCKHIVAAMLVCMRQPDRIEERPTLEQLLDRLNDIQTQQLIQELVAKQPELIDPIERYVNRIALSTPQIKTENPQRHNTIDPTPFRSQVYRILRDGLRYLEEGWEEDPITDEIVALILEAQIFIERGDANNALVILQAIAEACSENWDLVEEYGADNYEIVEALNCAFCEAILCAELSDRERRDLEGNLELWQNEWDASFSMSLEALRQGWDYPPLQRVLQGNITNLGAWEDEAPDYADELALIRLNILSRQERYQEYLYLAEAEGQTEQYLTMLASLDRVNDAMDAASSQMTSMEQAFALAQTLARSNSQQQALEIACKGLTLHGHCQYDLAIWTSELAEELAENTVATEALVKAFQARPSFEDYQKVEKLAGKDWFTLKIELLAFLRTHKGWGTEETKVDIFLHEGLIDEAIAVVSGLSSYDSNSIHRVMDAAIESHPDWVIQNATRRAESIMDAKKAELYYYAVEWLKKARAAYLASGRKQEWSIYQSQLIETHARKRKLMALLQVRELE
jgi:uncharacterized Zn finger protein